MASNQTTESSAFQIDDQVLAWEQKLAGYEVVACEECLRALPVDQFDALRPLLSGYDESRPQALYVSFDGLLDRRYSALLMTGIDQVALYYEQDGDLFYEFIGLMTLSEFWSFLDSFPNVYRHLHYDNRDYQ